MKRFLSASRWISAKSLLACLVLTAGSTPVSSVRAADPGPAEAFLDRPMPAGISTENVSVPAPEGDGSMKSFPMLRVSSFWSGVQLLGALSGKIVRLPKELAEWPDERTEEIWKLSLGVPQDGKVRELFERLCMTLELSWRYDAEGDVLNLEPRWKRDDSRSGSELVGALLGSRPASLGAMDHDTRPNRVGGHSLLLDPWRVAFDALLSLPANFPAAGSVRLFHDNHGHGMSLGIVENLCAGRMLDADGHVHILVLNRQQGMSNKEDPGEFAYYLFDENGKFTRGGVYAVAPGRVGAITNARIDEEQVVTVTFGWGSFAGNAVDLRFALTAGELVLQGSTDSKGVARNARDTQHLPDEPRGEITRLEYSVSAGPNP